MNVQCEMQITMYDPRFSKISILVCRCIMSSIFSTHIQWLPVPTACYSLRLPMEEMDYRYGGWLRIFRICANSRQGRSCNVRVDEKLRTPHRHKSASYKMLYRAFGGSWERPRQWKLDMRTGIWNARRL